MIFIKQCFEIYNMQIIFSIPINISLDYILTRMLIIILMCIFYDIKGLELVGCTETSQKRFYATNRNSDI